jgi:lipoyl(octanoyl) transferase
MAESRTGTNDERNLGVRVPTFPPLPPFHLWIDETPRPGWANMAIDLALVEQAQQGERWLRLYTWRPHCLSFGRHEPAARRYDVERIHALGLDTVRRPTGGRAVWHARELTYAVAAPYGSWGSLHTAYREIHQLLAGALGRLGIASTLAIRGRADALDAGACFARPVGGEVLVAGRKVIGSAQLRLGTALLQHGSILLRDDQRLVAGLLRGAGAPSTRSSEPEVPPLTDSIGLSLPAEVLAEAIGNAATQAWVGDWERVVEPPAVLQAAARHFQQFQSSGWTWAR